MVKVRVGVKVRVRVKIGLRLWLGLEWEDKVDNLCRTY